MKKKGRVIITGLITAGICILLLFLTGMIPKTAIEESIRESADYFYQEELFPYLAENQFNTRQDNYADSILVNIIYHIDQDELPLSLIRASYYNPKTENVNVSLWEAVQEEKEANVEYFRYWHGSMVLLRPLFLFTSITGARLLLGICLLGLTILTAIAVFRQGEKVLALCYLLGNLVVQTWMCAFCIEYITTFLVMNAAALCTLFLYNRWGQDQEKLNEKFNMLLAASGVVTCFVDFLTTETLTITVPLLILTILRFGDNRLEELKTEVKKMVENGLVWGLSYASMFGLKWIISAVALGPQAFTTALSSAGERISGEIISAGDGWEAQVSGLDRLFGALARNQGSLFPFRGEMKLGMAILLFWGVIFTGFALIYLFRDKLFSGKMICLCLIQALVPYLRYVLLANHAYLHYFFTYRAQLVTVMALFYCTWQFGLSRLLKGKNSP